MNREWLDCLGNYKSFSGEILDVDSRIETAKWVKWKYLGKVFQFSG